MTQLTSGSLFSGALGLDRAVERAFGARTVWVSDNDKGVQKLLAHRVPDIPNLGDIAKVDWSQVEPVDIITGGSPCQDISNAGRLAGMQHGTRSNLWVEMREAIAILKPAYVVWENVRGAYSTRAHSAMELDPGLLGNHPEGVPTLRALGRILGDLASLGFDAEWRGLFAGCKKHSSGSCTQCIGAAHARFRVFVVASHPARVRHEWRGPARRWGTGPTDGAGEAVELLPTPNAGNFNDGESVETWQARRAHIKAKGINGNGMGMPLGIAVRLLPTPSGADSLGGHESRGGARGNELLLKGIATHQDWDKYAGAIARWEAIHGPAPAPTGIGRTGRPKLSPVFSEWMMGMPAGWVTDVPGMTDNEAIKICGNGVVEAQAYAALMLMLER